LLFQEAILALERFWAERGCVVEQPYDVEVGAGTMCPATFFYSLGPEPWRVAYVQPSRRPADSRYGDNPNRLEKHYQYQVILKPAPADIQDIYLASLEAIGIEPRDHDIRFVEDDWESPSLGASGVGWQVWLDGTEITQFTYFQLMGSVEVDPVCVELTYGLERLVMCIQGVDSYTQIMWSPTVTYGDVRFMEEREQSHYSFDDADVASLFRWFDDYEREAERILAAGRVRPAYDFTLKCSHTFNLLDARGALSVAQRITLIERIRRLARKCAEGYIAERERRGYPLLLPVGARKYE
jgi:glycyl-tRNA synthetase alpha chain